MTRHCTARETSPEMVRSRDETVSVSQGAIRNSRPAGDVAPVERSISHYERGEAAAFPAVFNLFRLRDKHPERLKDIA